MQVTVPSLDQIAEPDAGAPSSAAPSVALQRRALVTRRDVILALVALAGEAVVLGMSCVPALPVETALLLHLGIVFLVGFLAYRRRAENADLTSSLLVLLLVSVAGPIGALLSLPALAWLRRPAQPSALLAAWYERIAMSTRLDEQTQLSDRVASGRVIDTTAPPPEALRAVIRSGSRDERQSALGLIARFFHPNYLPALCDALKCEEPVIRVQAAAVAARLRPRLADDVARLVSAATDDLHDASMGRAAAARLKKRLEMVRHLDAAVSSSLLDKPLQDAADAVARRLAASIDGLSLPLRRRDTPDGMVRLAALEQRLLASAQFAQFRLLRRRRRLAAKGFCKVRPWPQRRMKAAEQNQTPAAGAPR
jgi:hypothetical protein